MVRATTAIRCKWPFKSTPTVATSLILAKRAAGRSYQPFSGSQSSPRFLKLSAVGGFTADASGKWAKASLSLGCAVLRDDLVCFAATTAAGHTRNPVKVDARKPRYLSQFHWVSAVFGNLKTTLAWAYHALKYRKYATHYFSAFAYRLDRRLNLLNWYRN
jgi:hypothetical protein